LKQDLPLYIFLLAFMTCLKSIVEHTGVMSSETAYIVFIQIATATIWYFMEYTRADPEGDNPPEIPETPNAYRTNVRKTTVKFLLLLVLDTAISTSLYNMMERSMYMENGSLHWMERIILTIVTGLVKFVCYQYVLKRYWVDRTDVQTLSASAPETIREHWKSWIPYAVMVILVITALALFVTFGHAIAMPKLIPNVSATSSVLGAIDTSMSLLDGAGLITFLIMSFILSNEMCRASSPPMEYRFTVYQQPPTEKLGSTAPLLDNLQLILEARKVSLKSSSETRLVSEDKKFFVDYPPEVVAALCPDRHPRGLCYVRGKNVVDVSKLGEQEKQLRSMLAYFLELVRLHHADKRNSAATPVILSDTDDEWFTEDTPWVNNDNDFKDLKKSAASKKFGEETPLFSAAALACRLDKSFGDQKYLLPKILRPKVAVCRDKAVGYTVLSMLMAVIKLSAAYSWW